MKASSTSTLSSRTRNKAKTTKTKAILSTSAPWMTFTKQKRTPKVLVQKKNHGNYFLFFYDHAVFSINTYHFFTQFVCFIESQTRRQELTFKQMNSSRLQNFAILFLSIHNQQIIIIIMVTYFYYDLAVFSINTYHILLILFVFSNLRLRDRNRHSNKWSTAADCKTLWFSFSPCMHATLLLYWILPAFYFLFLSYFFVHNIDCTLFTIIWVLDLAIVGDLYGFFYTYPTRSILSNLNKQIFMIVSFDFLRDRSCVTVIITHSWIDYVVLWIHWNSRNNGFTCKQ